MIILYIIYWNNNWHQLKFKQFAEYKPQMFIINMLRIMLRVYDMNYKYPLYENYEYFAICELININSIVDKNITNDILDISLKMQTIYYESLNKQDLHKNRIHFNNGYYNLLTNVFKKRKRTDYITHFLNYNYIESYEISNEIFKDDENIIKKNI